MRGARGVSREVVEEEHGASGCESSLEGFGGGPRSAVPQECDPAAVTGPFTDGAFGTKTIDQPPAPARPPASVELYGPTSGSPCKQ